jgi:hypothetical protein
VPAAHACMDMQPLGVPCCSTAQLRGWYEMLAQDGPPVCPAALLPTLQQPAFCVLNPSSTLSASTSPYTLLPFWLIICTRGQGPGAAQRT